MSAENSKLFTPLRLGGGEHAITLSHRVVLAPLTRVRSKNHIPGDMVREYYAQRATPGGLMITEGIHPSIVAGSYNNVPGLYTDEQVSFTYFYTLETYLTRDLGECMERGHFRCTRKRRNNLCTTVARWTTYS